MKIDLFNVREGKLKLNLVSLAEYVKLHGKKSLKKLPPERIVNFGSRWYILTED